jgi:hypothetical protein
MKNINRCGAAVSAGQREGCGGGANGEAKGEAGEGRFIGKDLRNTLAGDAGHPARRHRIRP